MQYNYTPNEKAESRFRKKIGDLSQGFDTKIEPIDPTADLHSQMSERRFTHNGQECIIETHYKIFIGGEEFGGHLMVDQNGSVHHHGLPNYNFSSAVALVKTILDASQDQTVGEDQLAYIYEDGEHDHGHS